MGIKVQKWTTAAKLAVIAVITVIGLARLATGTRNQLDVYCTCQVGPQATCNFFWKWPFPSFQQSAFS
jgi:hypothetical protein